MSDIEVLSAQLAALEAKYAHETTNFWLLFGAVLGKRVSECGVACHHLLQIPDSSFIGRILRESAPQGVANVYWLSIHDARVASADEYATIFLFLKFF